MSIEIDYQQSLEKNKLVLQKDKMSPYMRFYNFFTQGLLEILFILAPPMITIWMTFGLFNEGKIYDIFILNVLSFSLSYLFYRISQEARRSIILKGKGKLKNEESIKKVCDKLNWEIVQISCEGALITPSFDKNERQITILFDSMDIRVNSITIERFTRGGLLNYNRTNNILLNVFQKEFKTTLDEKI